MSGIAIQRIFWLGCFLAIAVVGAPKIGRSTAALPLVDHGSNSSVNTLLEQTLGEPEMPEAIASWLARLPPGRPILLVAPRTDMSAALRADTVSYLAWPRPVEVAKNPQEASVLMRQTPDRFAAVGFCSAPPPENFKGKRFGPALWFISKEPVAE